MDKGDRKKNESKGMGEREELARQQKKPIAQFKVYIIYTIESLWTLYPDPCLQ